jgi:SAM-dependent methyltransferase
VTNIEEQIRATVRREIVEIIKRTKTDGSPNINQLWLQLNDIQALKQSVKQLGYAIGQTVFETLATLPIPTYPDKDLKLPWKPSTQADIETPWFRFWCDQIKCAPLPHRKLWEFAYILQSLFAEDRLQQGFSALGFGCGQEPLPSYFASKGIDVTVTDLDPVKVAGMGWAETGQHTVDLKSSFHPHLVTEALFNKHVELKYVDMNEIPIELHNSYDFCWSVCALEHLGSIQNGLEFIKNSVKCLKPGGTAIHTTEYNYGSDNQTIDNHQTVLFLRRHFLSLQQECEAAGLLVREIDFDVGSKPLDCFVDLPPYDFEATDMYQNWRTDARGRQYRPGHLKLSIDGFSSTCFGIVVSKPN